MALLLALWRLVYNTPQTGENRHVRDPIEGQRSPIPLGGWRENPAALSLGQLSFPILLENSLFF